MGGSLRFFAGAFVVAILALVAAVFFVAEPPTTIRLAAGRAGTGHGLAGEELKAILARSGVNVVLVDTQGSEEKLNRLTSAGPDAIDAAVLESGHQGAKSQKGVANLGAIYLEPIWLFGHNLPPGDDIQRLIGKRLAIASDSIKPDGLAATLFTDNGLSAKDVVFVPLSSDDAADAVIQGTVDAAWMVGDVEVRSIQKLLQSPDLELVSFDRAAAYARSHSFLVDVVLSKGAVDLGKNVPANDIKLVGPTGELIVRADMHPALQSLLLDAMHEAFSDGDAVSVPGMFPNKDLIDVPLSQEARRYYTSGPTYFRRVLPYWAASLAERAIIFLIPVVTLLVPLVRSVPPFLNWRIRRRINVWYHQLRLLETEGLDAKSEAEKREVCSKLEQLIDQVKQMKVPLDFADDTYRLRAHTRFVLDSLQRRSPR